MFPRLYRTRLLDSTRFQHEARLTFSSSSNIFVDRLSQRSVREHANLAAGSRRGKEDKTAENETDGNESTEEEHLDRWLLSGEKKVNDSEIRSFKDPYGHFCKNVAPAFRESSSRNWLGRDVPFPLNPSFKPPIPLSDSLRTRLYRAYTIDPKLNSVRALAARHHLSIKRIDAILKLKGLEEAWKKTNPLQTGFTKGMEHLLGVVEEAESDLQDKAELVEREVDLQDEADSNKARHRYQRLFWESVAEGEEPVMPNLLEAKRGAASAGTTFKGRTTLVERAPGRPPIMFVDVGDVFVKEKEKERREREGARRSMVKARRRIRNHT